MAVRHAIHAAAASFWREWHRDLRRHAADERFPYPIRVRLRDASERALRRSAEEERRAVVPRWDRRALRQAPALELSAEEKARGRQLAEAAGLRSEQAIVLVEGLRRRDAWGAATELLRASGYQVAAVRGATDGPWPAGVVDVSAFRGSALERFLLSTSAFVICSSMEMQQAATIRHAPLLRLDAREPFTAYPIHPNGMFLFATVVDLDTGRELEIDELLTRAYFRNSRNCGYRAADAGDVAAAIAEMVEGVRGGWRESEPQVEFRRAVSRAGAALGADLPHVIEWDAASGFVGDGRLARVQAERLP